MDGRVRLPVINWRIVLALLVAALIGAGATVGVVEFNRHTSTEAFCTSCHSMAPLAANPHYSKSNHISNPEGVRVSCGDCHIPKTNWFIETYTHLRSGIHDAIAEMTTNFDDRKAWEGRRAVLAKGVVEKMRAQGSPTCKGCHVVAGIKPTSPSGQAVHSALPEGVACVDCHQNLVHPPLPSDTAK
jgi:nitrate/TMAO reductase-like tetraheme cytochrome c subunit